ncbi:MAG TPA: ABC transporter substrate-binding protein [Ktedonosporobacter sp.]|nr:ABC transporter substrate-binding protein [Ktedonosporobacter sp.]
MMDHRRILLYFRPRKAYFSLLPAIFVICTLILAACGGTSTPNSSPGPSSKFGGNIKVGLASDVTNLDPLKSSALVDRQVMLNMYDTLVRVDEKNAIQPDLATTWSYTSPTQLVFTLRTDVNFHDGTPFNADAVVFNIKRILSTPSSPRFSEISAVKDVVAVDASHVQFDLKKAFSPLLATLTDRSGMVLSPAAIQKAGNKLTIAPMGAGSGPFMFVEWLKNDHLTIKRNPSYWLKDDQGNALPYLSSIRYQPFTDGNVEYTNLETGTIQAADAIDPKDVSLAKSNPDLIYRQAPGLSFFGFMLNTKSAPLNNVHVRRAIAWGTNRQEILDKVLLGIGVLSHGPISPTSWAYNSSLESYTYDVNKGKAELAQSGISGPVSFTMLVTGGSALNLQYAQFLQAELLPVGITMNIKQETFATILTDEQTFNFQAGLTGWSGRPDPDGNMYSWFHTGGGNNNMQYSNADVDKLLEDARTSSDQAQRTTDYQKAEDLINQDAPYIFIDHGVTGQITSAKIKNFTMLPTTIMVFTNVYVGS